MSFLPQGYEPPEQTSASSKFFNPSKIEDGKSVLIRILSNALTGYEYWNYENKPVRSVQPFVGMPADMRIEKDGKPGRVRHFWVFAAFNQETGEVQLWQVSQKKIQESIYSLLIDWGEPINYDIRVKRTGEGLKTEYTVTPVPPTPFTNQAAIAEASKIDLTALFDGRDPFNGLSGNAAPTNLLNDLAVSAYSAVSASATQTDFEKFFIAYEAKPIAEQVQFAKRCLQAAIAKGSKELADLIAPFAEPQPSLEEIIPF